MAASTTLTRHQDVTHTHTGKCQLFTALVHRHTWYTLCLTAQVCSAHQLLRRSEMVVRPSVYSPTQLWTLKSVRGSKHRRVVPFPFTNYCGSNREADPTSATGGLLLCNECCSRQSSLVCSRRILKVTPWQRSDTAASCAWTHCSADAGTSLPVAPHITAVRTSTHQTRREEKQCCCRAR